MHAAETVWPDIQPSTAKELLAQDFYYLTWWTSTTSSATSVEDWLDEVLSVRRSLLRNLVVRLEVEWRPIYGRGQPHSCQIGGGAKLRRPRELRQQRDLQACESSSGSWASSGGLRIKLQPRSGNCVSSAGRKLIAGSRAS